MSHLPDSPHNSSEFLPSPSTRRESGALAASYVDAGYANVPDGGAEPEATSFLEYWHILRRRRGTLILIASFGAILGFVITLPQTPVYQVRTSLEVVPLNDNFLNIKQSNPLSESSNSADTTDIETEIKILQSESLVDRVAAKVRGSGKADDTSGTGRVAAWRKLLNLPASGPVNARDRAVSYASSNYKVRASGQTRIIEITVDSMSPQVAADFANTLTKEFIDQNLESRFQIAQHTSEWLSKELDDMRVRLERSEDSLQAYARQAGLLFTGDKNNVSEEKLLQLQQALSAAQADRIIKQSRWEMAGASPAEALPDVLNNPTLREYQGKMTDLERQIAELRTTYTEESPKVERLQVQLTTIEAALNVERADILKRIKNEYDEALRRESLLQTDYSAQRVTVTGESEKAVQYDVMKHEVESNRQLYDAMLQQLKQATLASALRASNVRVVDPAKVPEHPYKPNVPLSSLIGLLAAGFLGAAFVIMQERVDRSIQEPGETPFFLSVPELGIVPRETPGRLRMRQTGDSAVDDRTTAEETAKGNMLPSRVELATWQRKPSVVAESFRATLISILFSGENGNRPRVMAVTSANPSEGKSTVVSNLGIAVAEVNQKVLLIDADLRKPRLHDVFGLSNERGLSDLLRSRDSVGEALAGVIQATHIPDLYVLTSGSHTSAATSLLYSNRMPELLQRLRAEFETVFIDTPPMLQIPDARVMGRMVDRVILVVRAGKTTRDAAMAARQRFSEDGTRLLGTILNDWDPKRSPNGHYGYYNGSYSGYYQSANGHNGGPGKTERNGDGEPEA